ncbi:c-type cytochrome [Endothiovibrio diazotrophicus]
MNRSPLAAAVVLAALASTGVAAEDGAALYQKNCLSCHGAEVYTRPDHRVTSRAGLTKQVRRCELALGLTWFDEQIDAVAQHLNDRFYHF